MPESQGYSYLLTIGDRFTRWPEDIPLSDISALTCARAFLYHWVSRYGVPSTLTSDRGRQFVSELWRKTAALLGTATNSTTSYHPQSNGMVERMHRTMKAALKAKLETDPNWIDVLPVVMLGMRAAVKQDLNCSAAEMVFGEALRLPGEYFVSADGDLAAADPAFVVDLRRKMRQMRPVPPVWHGGETRRNYVSRELAASTHVFVRVGAHRGPLQSPYREPFKVIDRQEKFYNLDLGTRQDSVSIDRLKPAFFEEANHAIVPRRPARTSQVRSPARPTHLGGANGSVLVVTSSGRLVRLPVRYGIE